MHLKKICKVRRSIPGIVSALALIPAGLLAGCATTSDPVTGCVEADRTIMIVRLAPDASRNADGLEGRREAVLEAAFGAQGYDRSGMQTGCRPVLHETFSSLPGFAMGLSADEADSIRRQSSVLSVTPDTTSAPTATLSSNSSISQR